MTLGPEFPVDSDFCLKTGRCRVIYFTSKKSYQFLNPSDFNPLYYYFLKKNHFFVCIFCLRLCKFTMCVQCLWRPEAVSDFLELVVYCIFTLSLINTKDNKKSSHHWKVVLFLPLMFEKSSPTEDSALCTFMEILFCML